MWDALAFFLFWLFRLKLLTFQNGMVGTDSAGDCSTDAAHDGCPKRSESRHFKRLDARPEIRVTSLTTNREGTLDQWLLGTFYWQKQRLFS